MAALEIVRFRIKPGADQQEFEDLNERFQREVAPSLPGLERREATRNRGRRVAARAPVPRHGERDCRPPTGRGRRGGWSVHVDDRTVEHVRVTASRSERVASPRLRHREGWSMSSAFPASQGPPCGSGTARSVQRRGLRRGDHPARADLMRIHAGPRIGDGTLWAALVRFWPTLLAFAAAFAFVGVAWTNHHNVFARVARVSRAVNATNLLLLAGIALVPGRPPPSPLRCPTPRDPGRGRRSCCTRP